MDNLINWFDLFCLLIYMIRQFLIPSSLPLAVFQITEAVVSSGKIEV